MSWRAGSCLHEIFGASVRDGLAKGRAPKPRAAQLSLCKPEKLVSPDVLVIPSWYHTLLFRQYPGYCTNGISARNQTLHRTIELRSSSPPRSSRSGAMSSHYSQRRLSKSEVTIDCYSEKRSRPSPWSGSAPTGTRAWGGPPVAVQETRQKSIFSSRKFGIYQHALAALEHAWILSPSIRSPHGSANGYASMETYLLFALYLLRASDRSGNFGTRSRSSYERAAELETFVAFLFSCCQAVYQVKKNNTVLLITVLLIPLKNRTILLLTQPTQK